MPARIAGLCPLSGTSWRIGAGSTLFSSLRAIRAPAARDRPTRTALPRWLRDRLTRRAATPKLTPSQRLVSICVAVRSCARCHPQAHSFIGHAAPVRPDSCFGCAARAASEACLSSGDGFGWHRNQERRRGCGALAEHGQRRPRCVFEPRDAVCTHTNLSGRRSCWSVALSDTPQPSIATRRPNAFGKQLLGARWGMRSAHIEFDVHRCPELGVAIQRVPECSPASTAPVNVLPPNPPWWY